MKSRLVASVLAYCLSVYGFVPFAIAQSNLAQQPHSSQQVTTKGSGSLKLSIKDRLAKILELEQRDKERTRQHSLAQMWPCISEEVPAGDLLAAVYSHEGLTLPTVTIAGQDIETFAARIEIEPGTQPISLLVFNARPMIWRIEGAKERVRKIYAIAHQGNSKRKTGTAFANVSADKVHYIQPGKCNNAKQLEVMRKWQKIAGSLTRDQKPSQADRAALKLLQEQFLAEMQPRQPQTYVDVYTPAKVVVPSGVFVERVVPVTPGVFVLFGVGRNYDVDNFDTLGDLANAFHDDMPGGLMRLNPKDVIFDGEVEPYITLPGRAGQKQLVEAGKIEMTPEGVWRVKAEVRLPIMSRSSDHTIYFIDEGLPVPIGGSDTGCLIAKPASGEKPLRNCLTRTKGKF